MADARDLKSYLSGGLLKPLMTCAIPFSLLAVRNFCRSVYFSCLDRISHTVLTPKHLEAFPCVSWPSSPGVPNAPCFNLGEGYGKL
jgi:hypothetical protein